MNHNLQDLKPMKGFIMICYLLLPSFWSVRFQCLMPEVHCYQNVTIIVICDGCYTTLWTSFEIFLSLMLKAKDAKNDPAKMQVIHYLHLGE